MFRVLTILTSIILIVLIKKYYSFQVNKLKIQNLIHKSTSLFQTDLKYLFAIEILANSIVYPPQLDTQIPHNLNRTRYNISLNAYIFTLMLGRLYILLRIVQQYTFWNSTKSQRLCKMNNFEPNIMFTIKVSLQVNPFTLVTLVLLVIIAIFAIAILGLEKFKNVETRGFQFDNIWNSLWCILVSMTTIGYGDIYPISMGGRFIVILAGISGVLILAMLVNILSSQTILTPS